MSFCTIGKWLEKAFGCIQKSLDNRLLVDKRETKENMDLGGKPLQKVASTTFLMLSLHVAYLLVERKSRYLCIKYFRLKRFLACFIKRLQKQT